MVTGSLASALAALGPAVGMALVKGVVVLTFALLLMRPLRYASAAWRGAVLTAALVAQAVLLAQAVAAPGWRWEALPLPAAWTREAAKPVDLSTRSVPTAVDFASLNQSAPTAIAPADGGDGDWGWRIAVAAWLAVALVLFARMAMGAREVRRIARAGKPVTDARWTRLLAECRGRVGVTRRPVSLVMSGEVEVPFTCGVLRPRIVLPAAAEGWRAGRARAVLLHELAHAAHLDAALQFLGHAVAAACWPSPLVHAVRRLAEAERERAADDAVLRAGVRPSSYVAHVVGVVRGQRTLVAAAALGAGGSPLERRLRDVLAPARSRRPVGRPSLALLLLGAAALALPLAALSPAPPRTSDVTTATGEMVTGCDYAGGRHLNRTGLTPTGRPVWEVAWAGQGCEVRWRAVGDVRVNLAGVSPAAEADSAELIVAGPGARRLVVARDGGRTIYVEETGGRAIRGAEPPAWLGAFLLELDRHTAFAADVRFPALARGGLDAVLAEAARTQGDHAGLVYLTRAAEALELSEADVARLLRASRGVGQNDAELERLLGVVARRHPLRSAAAQDEYLAAADRLRARAARESAVAALRSGRRLAADAEAGAVRLLVD